jgi:hypothetical protein
VGDPSAVEFCLGACRASGARGEGLPTVCTEEAHTADVPVVRGDAPIGDVCQVLGSDTQIG